MQFAELAGNVPLHIAVPYGAAGITGGGELLVPYPMKINAASWLAGAAITGQATNFFTLSFFNRGGAGAGTVQWATAIAYSSGGVTAAKATPVALTLSSTASDLLIAAGDVLSVEITTTGTGLICPGGAVYLNATMR